MRYLGLALYAEGPTDYRFLSPILRRVADDLCLREATEPVSIGEVLALDASRGDRPVVRASQILASAKAADGAFDILFIHADGAGDPRRVRAERVEPAVRLMAVERPGSADGIVAVVPIRETEAWALADGDALRLAFGTILGDDQLGIPTRITAVEALIDPKSCLDQAYEKAVGRKRPGRKAAGVLDILGERIRLECLRGVPAFRGFEEDFFRALRSLRYLRDPST
jgi:Domain of unknown function (DUF4276)